MSETTRGGAIMGSRRMGQLKTGYRKQWALVIGIDLYEQHNPLRNAVRDAQEFAKLLSYYQFNIHELYNQDASKDGILSYLRDTMTGSDVREEDSVIIFFAGHGISQDGKRGYIVPAEARSNSFADCISMGELTEVCQTLKANHILIVLDCCFSGLADGGTRSAKPAVSHDPQLIHAHLSKPSWQIMMAGDRDEPVADMGENGEHSAFTYHLLQGLSGAADIFKDRIITGQELVNYVYREVYNETGGTSQPQQPFIKEIHPASDRGDFIFQIPDGIPHPWHQDGVDREPLPVTPVSPSPSWTDSVFQRDRLSLILGILSIGITLILAGVGINRFLSSSEPDPLPPALVEPTPAGVMTGNFNIAFAQFSVNGEPNSPTFNQTVSENAYNSMLEELDAIEDAVGGIELRGPDSIGVINGRSPDDRRRSAEEIALEIGADVIVFAHIDFTTAPAEMVLEFAIPNRSFTTADNELAGEHQFGTPIPLRGDGNLVTRQDVNRAMNERVDLLSTMIVGLSYYEVGAYEDALTFFEQLRVRDEWDEIGGKEVLFLMLGNTYGKLAERAPTIGDRNDFLESAERSFDAAINLDPQYARALSGKGSTLYLQALSQGLEAQDVTRSDLETLDLSIEAFNEALLAENQPELSDIQAKVSFGLGQAYTLEAFATESNDFDRAIRAFDRVIQFYNNGENPRIQEIAAESYARLGRIYDTQGETEAAIAAYQSAIDLLPPDYDRRKDFEENLKELTGELDA